MRSPQWLSEPTPSTRRPCFRIKRKPLRPRTSRRRLASSLLLVGWGCAKLAAARLSGAMLSNFCRLNVPAVVGLLTLQARRGRAGFLPLQVQTVLAGLYAAVALGVTEIPRPGNDRYPDRFLEYLPGRLHLA